MQAEDPGDKREQSEDCFEEDSWDGEGEGDDDGVLDVEGGSRVQQEKGQVDEADTAAKEEAVVGEAHGA